MPEDGDNELEQRWWQQHGQDEAASRWLYEQTGVSLAIDRPPNDGREEPLHQELAPPVVICLGDATGAYGAIVGWRDHLYYFPDPEERRDLMYAVVCECMDAFDPDDGTLGRLRSPQEFLRRIPRLAQRPLWTAVLSDTARGVLRLPPDGFPGAFGYSTPPQAIAPPPEQLAVKDAAIAAHWPAWCMLHVWQPKPEPNPS
jgi:hypothetical protein